MNRRTWVLSTAATLSIAPFAARADETGAFPTKPIRLIVPSAPGSAPDLIMRLICERVGRALGQPIVIENRPGAIGTLGLNAVARAAPDGYTLGLISMPFAIAPALLAEVPYDTERDLAPVTWTTTFSNLLVVVPAASPARSIDDLVARARARPGVLTYASSGNATPSHLAGELFARAAAVKLNHIPYQGGPATATALVRGDVDLHIGLGMPLAPFLKSGQVRALATTAPQRLAAHPDVPTLAEIGIEGVELTDWHGVVAPAGTPPAVIGRLHAGFAGVLATVEARQRLEALGVDVIAAGPAAFAKHIRREIPRLQAFVRAVGISAK